MNTVLDGIPPNLMSLNPNPWEVEQLNKLKNDFFVGRKEQKDKMDYSEK